MNREQWDERYGTEELIWKADPNRFLVEELDALAPGRALDVACGEGRNAVWLASKGWRVTGARLLWRRTWPRHSDWRPTVAWR